MVFRSNFWRPSSQHDSDQSSDPDSPRHQPSQFDFDQSSEPDPPTATSSSEEIPSDPNELQHAAFRTTSFFLPKLLTRSLGTGRNLQSLTYVQAIQLKVLNAFSTIAVINSEVVSVVANTTSWGRTLQLIAAQEGQPIPVTEDLLQAIPSVEGHEPVTAPEGRQSVSGQSRHLMSKVVDHIRQTLQTLQFVFTTNPRVVTGVDPRDDQDIPIVVDASSPANVSESDLPALVQECSL